MDWSSQLTFLEFTQFCGKLQALEEKPKRDKMLSLFLKSCRERMRSLDTDTGQSLFPLMRILLPFHDKARVYRIKEAVMANLFIDMMQIGDNSAGAKKLKDYKRPENNSRGQDSDFAAVLFSVIQSRSYESKKLSVAEINERLDQIVAMTDAEGKKMILRDLFRKLNAEEVKWLVRVILKTMPLGLGEVTLFKALHPDAKDLFDVNASLERVCQRLVDPAVRLHHLEVSLMTPFRPHLADKKNLNDIPKVMKDRMFFIETKYDGERCQLHKKGDVFKYFSRNGNDFTNEYGEEAVDPRMFTTAISACLDSSVEDIILDGEMCPWSTEQNCILQKGEQFNIRQLRNDDKVKQCLVLYDILLLNGRVLSSLPLRERLELLNSVVTTKEGTVEMAQRVEGHSARDIRNALNDAIDRSEEGLVVKDSESEYKPGARAGGGWFKVKPDYVNNLMDTLDLTILGGYFGSGHHSGKISKFLMGVRSEDGEGFLSVCRVATGFNVMELQDLVHKCVKGSKQQNILLGKEKPPVLFDPVQCPVLEVKGTEIVPSEQYAAGVSVRFPRILKRRDDKDSSSCTSIQELRVGMLTNGEHLNPEEQEGRGTKRKRASRKPQLGQIYRQQLDLGSSVSQCLDKKVVVVEPGRDDELKIEVEKLVVKHGGKVEQNVRRGITSLYVETGMTVKGRGVVSRKELDVVRSSWLTDQAENERIVLPRPHEHVFMTQKTEENWRRVSDKYMDTFIEEATRGSLKYSMEKVLESKDDCSLDDEMKAEFEEEYDLTDMKHTLLRGLVIHLPASDGETEQSIKRDLLELEVRHHGGRVSKELDESVTHVLTDQVQDSVREVRRRRVMSGAALFQLLDLAWLEESIANNRLAPVEEYRL